MNLTIKRKLAVGVAGLALVAGGGGIAVAAGGGDGAKERQAFLDDAAKALDVSPDKLEGALERAYGARLAQAVKDGRLTQEQADRLKRRLADKGIPVPGVGGPGGGFGGPGFGAFRHGGFAGGPGGLFKQGLDTAADHLGLTSDALRKQLRGGKSLADVATAQGKDVAGLKSALVAFAKAELAEAVKAGKLPHKRADRIGAKLGDRISDLVDGKRPALEGRGRHGGHGPFGGGHGRGGSRP